MSSNPDKWTLDGHPYYDIGNIMRGTIACWWRTRVLGVSASMGCDQDPVDVELLRFLDKRYQARMMELGDQ